MSINTATVAPAVVSGLAPYTGPWEKPQATHLLRRALFGPKRDEILDATAIGLSATLDKLFGDIDPADPPVNHFFTEDPNVPIGATWVDSPHLENVNVSDYRSPSMKGWLMNLLIDSPYSIREKIMMFYVNHFGMAGINDNKAEYQFIDLFQQDGLGSFQEMIEKISVLPAMLNFLDGHYSSKWAPNENYARELLELFTIQKGPLVGPEDYTYYTEQDVRVFARCLTGWQYQGFASSEHPNLTSHFVYNRHDDETNSNNPNQERKQLSERFGSVIITNSNEDEYKDVINVVFQQAETPKAICREFYRFFVHYDITQEVEDQVISPLAEYFADNDFNVGLTLRLLFESQHFFDIAVMGPMIKNPYEFIFSIARPLGGYNHLGMSMVNNSDDLSNIHTIYNIGRSYYWRAGNLDMLAFQPPSVAGWAAYYQTPNFYRNWIGSATLQERRRLVQAFTNQGLYTQTDDGDYDPRPFDWLGFIDNLTNPYDVNDVVQETVEIFLPREIHEDQFNALKSRLTGDVSDQEWTIQYGDYQASPNNPDVVNPLTNKVKDFFRSLFSMAEFHLQ